MHYNNHSHKCHLPAYNLPIAIDLQQLQLACYAVSRNLIVQSTMLPIIQQEAIMPRLVESQSRVFAASIVLVRQIALAKCQWSHGGRAALSEFIMQCSKCWQILVLYN